MFHEDEDPNDFYELLQLLGEGSYGSVYKGVNRVDRSTAAVKIVSYGNKASVTGEIEFLRKLKCDYVVSYIDGYLFDGELWILMEFCAGGSLSDLRDITKHNLTEPEVRAVTASAMLGLTHLHSLNNIHRDIKAGNILLTADGKAKLADFGVSAQLTSSKDMRKTMIGTPFWMAPELIQETKYNGKADIWSMGITILELVEGHPPHFNVHPMRAIFMIPMKPAPRLAEPSKWSVDMIDFIEKNCLVKEVDGRAAAKELLQHKWLVADVELTRQNCGMEILRKIVTDNWNAIEASRVNENVDEGPDEVEYDGTDSDKTATPGELAKDLTAEFSGSPSIGRTASQKSVEYPNESNEFGTNKSGKSTMSKKNRPFSKRIKSHATSTHSKSTTGEGRNTSSSQSFGKSTFTKFVSDDNNATLTFNRKASFDVGEGTIKVGVLESAKNTMKVARFGEDSYFKKNSASTTNPALVYDLLLLLGEGSYGRVFKAMHKFEHVEVAIKIIPCDTQTDVNAEIQFLRKLNCPYIVSFVDGFLYDEEVWIVMEYCGGGSLSDLREITGENLTEPQLKLVVTYCVLGLQHLHSLMSIHRDIKAGNILLSADGIAKLADFGVSAQMQSATAKRRTVIGTPFWMAPEVIQETSYDGMADIWSLGITILELGEGRPPHFEVHPMRAIFLIPIKPAPRVKDPLSWSAEMVDFLCRCLVKEPEARMTAAELLTHPWIEQLCEGVEKGQHPDHLRSLVADNIVAIYKARENRRGSKMLLQKRNFNDVEEEICSVDTMQLKEGSRETSLNSESTVNINEGGVGGYESDDTADNNIVKPMKAFDSEAVNTLPRGDTWFTVDSLRNSIRAPLLRPSYVPDSDDDADFNNCGTFVDTRPSTRLEAAWDEEKESNSLANKEILRQIATLDQKYKADKEKLRMKYEMSRNQLKLLLAPE